MEIVDRLVVALGKASGLGLSYGWIFWVGCCAGWQPTLPRRGLRNVKRQVVAVGLNPHTQ